MKRLANLADFAGLPEAIALGLLVVAFIVSAQLSPYFIGSLNFSFILTDSVEIGIMACTMTMLIVMGEIDISVSATMGLSMAVMGVLLAHGAPFILAAIIALAVGACCGLLNGVLCVVFGLPSLVLTLGTAALFRGLAQVFLGTQSISTFPSWFVGWNTRYVIGLFTYTELFWVVCIISAAIVLHRRRFGRQLTFIGANPKAARFSGIRIGRAKVLVFGATGLSASVAGLILVSRLQSLDNTTGSGLALVIITAVLLGGTDFKGGRGTIIGTTIAIVLISVLENGLQLAGVSSQVTTAVIGGLLVLSVLIDVGAGAGREFLASRRMLRGLIPESGRDVSEKRVSDRSRSIA